MDPVLLARIQFAFTIGFHFIFPPLTIGMSWLIFWFMTQYRRSGDEADGRQVRFWLKLFAITFAVGVATGITMEFQFGTNWAAYSRFVGDIFGAPLAAEGIFAFFLESTFLGVLLFGWNRFSRQTLWVSSLLIAVGSTLSAFWIIVANSWMQTPAGFRVVDGRAELTNFFEAVFNPSTMPRFIHQVDACLITGAFFMLGVSAWYLSKGRHVAFARRSLKVSLVVGFIAAFVQLGTGHWHGVVVAETQPEKLAAFEAHFETRDNAPMILFGIPDEESGTVKAALEVPSVLSIMVGNSPDTVVPGLNDFPRDEWPPVTTVFVSFRLMFYLGMYFIALTGLGLLLMWKKKLYDNRLFLKLAAFSLPLPIIANELGWIATEVGRQPWIVYRIMRTSEAVSITVPAGHILFSIIMFCVIYAILGVLWVYLLRRAINKGPDEAVVAVSEGAVS